MNKKVLFSTFLILFTLIFLNTYKAQISTCNLYKKYNDLSILNFKYRISNNDLKNIIKICTNKICTYSLNSNIERLIVNHRDNVLDFIKNDERKIETDLKGIKIDSIYFRNCI